MIQALITFVIYIIILGLVGWLLVYLVDNLPMLQPFRQIARTVIVVFCVLILILLLLGLLGVADMGLPRFR